MRWSKKRQCLVACACWYSQLTSSWQRRYPNKEVSSYRCYWPTASSVTSNDSRFARMADMDPYRCTILLELRCPIPTTW